MKTSTIKLEAFNDSPGAEAVTAYLQKHSLRPYIQVVDLEAPYEYYTNRGDTVVLAIRPGASELMVALALGQMAVWFNADEFTWKIVDGTYILRFWWD